NTDVGFQNVTFYRFAPRFHVRGLQMRVEVCNGFPLLNHDDRVWRGGLEARVSGGIHHRRVAVAAFFFQNGWDNFNKLIQYRLAVILAWTGTNYSNMGKHEYLLLFPS